MIVIKIATVDVKVTMENNDLSTREKKILEVLLLNMCAQANAHSTKMDMALNPLEKDNPDILLHFQFAWQSSLSVEVYENLRDAMTGRITNALKMCELNDTRIHYKENTYLDTHN